MEDVNGCGGDGAVLQETFYILSKKNTVYRVKLSEKGLSLVKESNGNTKSETIRLDDIIGCRCMRSKCKPGPSCACRPSARKDLKEADKDEKPTQDKSDISAYLYIYAYVLKKYKVTSGVKRERMTITLRFRSFDKFEENMREAQKWRVAIKCLMKDTPIPRAVLNSDENAITLSPGEWSCLTLCDQVSEWEMSIFVVTPILWSFPFVLLAIQAHANNIMCIIANPLFFYRCTPQRRVAENKKKHNIIQNHRTRNI